MRLINSQLVCNMLYLCLIIFICFTYSLRSLPQRNKSQYKMKSLNLFRHNPQMRKIAIAYLHHKVINNPINENTFDKYLVYNDRDIIKSIFQNVIPPVKLELSELNHEIDNTLELFHQKSSLEEHEFSSKILLDNTIWENVGETVIKEMIYIDNSYEGYFQTQSYLCNTCIDQLMESLKEDGSSVIQLNKNQIKILHETIQNIQNNKNNQQTFLIDSNIKLHDFYGNPTVFKYILDSYNNNSQKKQEEVYI